MVLIGSYRISWIEIRQMYINYKEEQHFVRFLMAFWDNFEGLYETILHHTPLSNVDFVVNEQLAKDIALKYQSQLHPDT